MKRKSNQESIIQDIILLIPLILYSLFKNGYLIYERGLISGINVFKSLYLILISIIVKFIIDIIRYKKIKIDYNLLSLILVAMIMPYNINILLYPIILIITYILSLFIDKYLKYNKVCFIYLIIILISNFITPLSYLNPLELKFTYSFSFLDILMGRNIGGIATSSIFFSLIAYTILIYNYYYKKDIPLVINFIYLILMFIYYLITKDNSYLLNSEVIFASIFICTIPIFSPYKRINQIIYSIFIGIITFILTITFNNIISIYIATFILSLFSNLYLRQMLSKSPLAKKA